MARVARRAVLGGLAALAAAPRAQAQAGGRLSPWRPGTLEIHHLATGRGDCTLVIGPDGTGLMVDAGATASPPEMSTAPRPDGTRRPGEWIARYARRRLPDPDAGLDYFVATHIHPDHIGDVTPRSPPAPGGAYRLTGVSDVAAGLPIRQVFDRGWPDYADLPPIDAPFAANYLAFLKARAAAGLANGRLEPGRADQLVLRRRPRDFPGFEARVLAANGRVWTGRGTTARATFPPLAALAPQDRPTENMASVALRIGYAGFAWFCGGDLTAETSDGALPWADIEGAAARACGPVDVAVACHHGYYDAVGAAAVAALRPRVWVVTPWHVTHPDLKPLERMTGPRLYPGPRELFLTQVTPEALKVGDRFLRKAASVSGHVVVRVEPTGLYSVFVTDPWSEADRVLAAFGPYAPHVSGHDSATIPASDELD
ncbi:MAG: MBL fold metallo-hydrolase [Phenylobacterium sp.]|uniref:ComEC/Rec2 family competence protein n=1 Tax=Phenylobacterium sp. TaxID=1871053 RepID=UPI0025EBF147|nr:MBL fold metallo-hydrolase [Phenylobacterium sp.]MBI1199539.1 MBL fold metallo-hydrolase [Phenylobacterium sp.]